MEWICNLNIFLLQLIDKSCWFPFPWPCNMYKNIMMTTTINKWEMITTSQIFSPFTTPLLIASLRNILEPFDTMRERESAFPTSRSIEITCVKHIYKNTKKSYLRKPIAHSTIKKLMCTYDNHFFRKRQFTLSYGLATSNIIKARKLCVLVELIISLVHPTTPWICLLKRDLGFLVV